EPSRNKTDRGQFCLGTGATTLCEYVPECGTAPVARFSPFPKRRVRFEGREAGPRAPDEEGRGRPLRRGARLDRSRWRMRLASSRWTTDLGRLMAECARRFQQGFQVSLAPPALLVEGNRQPTYVDAIVAIERKIVRAAIFVARSG